MEFKEKLNKIIYLLDVSNATLANISDVHPSLISRFRSGERVPREDSSQFLKLCKGISLIVEEKQLHKQIGTLCNLDDNLSITDAIRCYLHEPESEDRNNQHSCDKNNKNKSFSEKLDIIMNMLELSNIKLAKRLNVDSSLISRYRSGQRAPQKNSELVSNLCKYLSYRITSGGFEKQTADLIGIPVESVIKADDEFLETFSSWLTDKVEHHVSGAMDNFLDTIGSFTFHSEFKMQDASTDEFMDILEDTTDTYTGLEGFRRAIIRFLTTVSLSKPPRTLKLFSDQRMDWLTGDSTFAKQWITLMITVLLKKNHIQIIHHIDRNLTEMLVGIEKWMPLYMTGAVEAFYCKKADDTRFAHTMFIAPGLASIHANLVSGTEDHGRYHYLKNREDVSYFEEQYNALMNMSKPLIKVYNERNISSFNYCMEETSRENGKTKNIFLSLNIAIMSSESFEKILIKNGFEPTKIDELLIFHEVHSKRFFQNLKNGGVTDYVSIPSLNTNLNGNARLMLPDFISERPVYYSKQELSEHMDSVISCLKENENYNMVLLRELPHKSIQICIKGNVSVTVNKVDNPSAAFWFGHPAMSQAFDEYFKTVENRAGIPVADKKELIGILEKYL